MLNVIKRDDRCCPFCKNAVENEIHFLLRSNLFNPLRLKYFSTIANISSKSVVDEEYILDIMKSYDSELTVLLMKYIDDAFALRRDSLKVP